MLHPSHHVSTGKLGSDMWTSQPEQSEMWSWPEFWMSSRCSDSKYLPVFDLDYLVNISGRSIKYETCPELTRTLLERRVGEHGFLEVTDTVQTGSKIKVLPQEKILGAI